MQNETIGRLANADADNDANQLNATSEAYRSAQNICAISMNSNHAASHHGSCGRRASMRDVMKGGRTRDLRLERNRVICRLTLADEVVARREPRDEVHLFVERLCGRCQSHCDLDGIAWVREARIVSFAVLALP